MKINSKNPGGVFLEVVEAPQAAATQTHRAGRLMKPTEKSNCPANTFDILFTIIDLKTSTKCNLEICPGTVSACPTNQICGKD